MHIIIYTWKSQHAIDWGKWEKNIHIRQMPFSRYFQHLFAKIFYRIWIMIDRPEKILINFLYHGEKSLPKDIEYYYILPHLGTTVSQYLDLSHNIQKNQDI